MIWVVFGLAVGDWVAWQLVNPDLTFGGGWSSFGASARFTPPR